LPRVGTGIYTETLARLYTQQGFFDQALDIYRHLAQAQPRNRQWRERIVALEQQQATAAAAHDSRHAMRGVPRGRGPYQERERRVLEYLERWLQVLRQQRMA
jgi:hypothetical protein